MRSAAEIRAIATKIKRETRNVDLLDLCDWVLSEDKRFHLITPKPDMNPTVTITVRKPKRDRAAYMRKYRAKK